MKALRYVGKKGCEDPAYLEALGEPPDDVVILDLVSKRPNIVLRATIDEQPLYLSTSSDIRDFRDIAVMSYILDTLALREAGVDFWSREFECIFPVRNARLWKANGDALSRLLTVLAGDNYRYDWLSAVSLPAHPKHRARVRKGFDAVCLFSGGIDSLLGAHKLLQEGKRLLLVGHQSEQATASAQTQVFQQLTKLFPKQASLIQFRVSMSRSEQPLFSIPEGGEETHRVRSFLFLGLAVSVAAMAAVHEIYMPENGLIALNPPFELSRLGTCSTRTAHPRFLSGFLDFSKAMGIFSGVLKNSFLYESKTDMVRSFDPRLKTALLRTVSCARPSRYQDKHVRHCGYCVPCIYRRAAFIGCGLDSPSDYAFDIFKGFTNLTATARLDFTSLVEFAQHYRQSSALNKQATVLSQGYFSPCVGAEIGPYPTSDYSPWVRMLDRWTGEFLSLVGERVSASTKKAIRWSQAISA